MKIHGVVIDHFRGIEHLELHGVPDSGVVVISGDNEQGKSTLMEAVLGVLREKHTATNKNVKPWKTVGSDENPRVSLNATIGPYEVEITKQWLGKKMSTLRLSGPETQNLSGRPADDRLEELLAQYTDADLLGALFMEQGEATAMAQAAGIPALTRVLDERTGQESRDVQADSALVQAAEKEYARYYSIKTGKNQGELKEAEKAENAAQETLNTARSDMENLNERVEKVERLKRRLSEAEAELPGAEKEAEKAEAEYRAAHKATEERKKAEKEFRDAAALWESAHAAVEARRALQREYEEAAEEWKAASQSYEAAREAAAKDKEALVAATEARTKSREVLTQARQNHARARKVLDLARGAARLGEVEELLRQAAELHERIAATGQREVSPAQLKAVEEAYSEVRVAEAVRSRSAARLHLEGPEGTTVLIDDTPATLPQEIELREGMRLSIGEVSITYSQGAGEQADPVAEAREALEALIQSLGCDGLDEVLAAEENTRQRAALKQEYGVLMGAQRPETLEAEAVQLRETLKGEADLPTIQEATEAEEQAAALLTEREEAHRQAEEAVENLEQFPSMEAAARADTQREFAAERREDLRARLEKAREASGEEALADTEREAEVRRDTARLAYEAAKENEEGASPEHHRRLWEGAQAECDSLRTKVAQTTGELDRLSSYIEFAHGVGERLAEAEAQAQVARRRAQAIRRRAEAARSLYEALVRHRDAARARYAEPFAQQLTALAGTVFGRDVEFRLGEDLSIQERIVSGKNVPLGDLSGGAQEQVALIMRLAIANLVGEEAPVFIDDALGSTDPDRLALMATLLSQVGERRQVFVLTCTPQRYARVVGKREYPIEELKSS
ncbi:AAA family ATPase [Corynebacterium lowii]|uniref:Chromosome segregation protein n=1 Tax=Corynebacterium lowii TaxID=1544413 RepID=A0A0Q0UEQ4_9CORY|nr:hypothetical protein [Corynebacterium lowii]KQB86336.1 chromosome segregation protein [Corynebacterium lowii]MDP9850821.1 DNA repair exonuclease SbcCD ATPase subunit [Corynebacterium lowii]